VNSRYGIIILAAIILSCILFCKKGNQDSSPVVIVNKEKYFEITMDYTSGISAMEMGKQLGGALLKINPEMPTVFDGLIQQLAISKKISC